MAVTVQNPRKDVGLAATRVKLDKKENDWCFETMPAKLTGKMRLSSDTFDIKVKNVG